MSAYYNEIDPKAAAWLRELINAGHIAPGVVDERSIEDVTPDELREFTQCHFFAGIGVWSYALRRAGWSDDTPVWTGSCPCQPFSAAGKGAGFTDERHLWPAWYHLITQCEPGVVFGEQVASKDGLGWLDLVQTDLEGAGYASGAADICAAGVGAPHIRQRLWFAAERLADTDANGRDESMQPLAGGFPKRAWGYGLPGGVGDADDERPQKHGEPGAVHLREPDGPRTGRQYLHTGVDSGGPQQPGPTNGLWGAADWLYSGDGKWRAVEPGTFPLVNGAPARVGRLRGYGNAINAEVARVFIESYMERNEPC